MFTAKRALCLAMLGLLFTDALANTKGRAEVVVQEAAPQATGLLLPTALPAALPAALPTVLPTAAAGPSPLKPAAATVLPAGVYPVQTTAAATAAAALPAQTAPLGVAVPSVTATPQFLPTAAQPGIVTSQIPTAAVHNVFLPQNPQIPQSFPAATPNLLPPVNPNFPPLIPGGSASALGAAPLSTVPSSLPGDGALGTGGPAFPSGLSAAADRAPTAGAGLGSLLDTPLPSTGSSSTSSSGSGFGMGSSLGDPFGGSSSSTLGGGGSPGGASGGMGETLRSRRAMANAADSTSAGKSVSMAAGLLMAFLLML